MLDHMAVLNNKPGWQRKIFDDHIVGKWRAEALAAGDSWRTRDESQMAEVQGLAPKATLRQREVTEAMFQYVGEGKHTWKDHGCQDHPTDNTVTTLYGRFSDYIAKIT